MHHLQQVLLLLASVTIISKMAGALSNRFGQPAVFGEILAGLVLGPSVLNILGWLLFAPHGGGAEVPALAALMHDLSEIGVILLMFVAGLETDLAEMRRVGRVAFWAAFGGVVLPLFGGAGGARLFGYGWPAAFFIGAVLTATSVSISAQTLMELKSLRSKEGSAILGAAVIDDVMGLIVLSIVVAFAGGAPGAGATGSTGMTIVVITLRMLLYFVLAWYLGRALLGRLTGWFAARPVSEPVLAFVVAVAFMYAWAAEALGGIAAITGSYIAGVLFSQTAFKGAIDRGIHPLTYSFFVPVFFVNIGLQANVRQLGAQIGFTALILAIAVAGKVIGCAVCARLAGFDARESLRVGVGMISRGEVGLIVATYGLTHEVITREVFSVMVLMVLVTTMITPIWLRYVFPRVEEARAAVPESIAHLENHPPAG